MTTDLQEIITLVLLSHADSHEGRFWECEEHLCPTLRQKLTEYINTEATLQAVQEALA